MAEYNDLSVSILGLARASLIVVLSLPFAVRFESVRRLSTRAFLVADFVSGIT